jgi:hypothetical protein
MAIKLISIRRLFHITLACYGKSSATVGSSDRTFPAAVQLVARAQRRHKPDATEDGADLVRVEESLSATTPASSMETIAQLDRHQPCGSTLWTRCAIDPGATADTASSGA